MQARLAGAFAALGPKVWAYLCRNKQTVSKIESWSARMLGKFAYLLHAPKLLQDCPLRVSLPGPVKTLSFDTQLVMPVCSCRNAR